MQFPLKLKSSRVYSVPDRFRLPPSPLIGLSPDPKKCMIGDIVRKKTNIGAYNIYFVAQISVCVIYWL